MPSDINTAVTEGLTPSRSLGSGTIALLIVAPAASPALTLWANNKAQVPKAYRLAIIVIGFVILGLAVFWVLRRMFSDFRVAGLLTFFVVLALTSGGRLMEDYPWAVRWVVALGAIGLIAAIVHLLRDLWLLDVVVIASALAVLVPPILSGAWAGLTTMGTEISAPVSSSLPTMNARPDVVLVVVDGYTSLPVLRELFDFEDVALEGDLVRAGFELAEPAFSPYPMTHLAVSSLLELDYVTEDVPRTTTRDGRTLEQVMSGDSYLVELLAKNGYQVTMVESGWHMSTCGEQVDLCIADRFIDEGVGIVLSQSLLWSLIEPFVGSAFTHGARHAMEWTADHIAGLVNNGSPDFVFIHVLAPHPPLFLDAACSVVSDRRLKGMALGVVGADTEEARARLAGYVSQVQCINGFIRDLAEEVAESDALVFVTGDHGSDAMSQLVTLPEQWSDFQVLERMSVFLAVKPTPGCERVSSLVTVVLLRSLVSCAGVLGLDPIEERGYVLSLDDDQPAFMRILDAKAVEGFATCLMRLETNLECP